MSNAITQLLQNLYGLDAFSFKKAYLRCIAEQLQSALNNKGRRGTIYNGLTHFILAKHGGSQNIPHIKTHDCLRSPITCTFFLLKHEGELNLKSTHTNFPFDIALLEQAWLQEMQNEPQEDHRRANELL